MGKSTAFETDLLTHFFNNGALANYGDATGLVGSTGAGSFYVALHTADPGIGGTQATSEATYTGYGRVAVARSSAGWTISGGNVTNTAVINFPACTAGSNTITHVSIGITLSGATKILYSAALAASLAVSNGITPSFNASAISLTES